jgi:hypothetical protein
MRLFIGLNTNELVPIIVLFILSIIDIHISYINAIISWVEFYSQWWFVSMNSSYYCVICVIHYGDGVGRCIYHQVTSVVCVDQLFEIELQIYERSDRPKIYEKSFINDY